MLEIEIFDDVTDIDPVYNQQGEKLDGMNKEFKELRSQCFRSISDMDTEATKMWC